MYIYKKRRKKKVNKTQVDEDEIRRSLVLIFKVKKKKNIESASLKNTFLENHPMCTLGYTYIMYKKPKGERKKEDTTSVIYV